ncbi:MAG: hypothetical protein QMD04_11130 [Anaerolineales bacterium]|nr:hypothetical protein [Anaerolineales bacterium]
MSKARSIKGVTIRLPAERWVHITEEHAELAGYYYDVLETIQQPLAVFEGNSGEYLAASEIDPGKYLIVVYQELSKEDGFVITAFMTKRWRQVERRKKIWPQ